MGNRFFQFNPQEHVESYVPLPWDKLGAMAEMYDKKSEQAQLLAGEIGKGIATIKNMPKDSDIQARKEFVDSWNNKLLNLTAKATDDPVGTIPELRQAAFALNKDLTTGVGYELNRRYSDWSKNEKLLQEDKNLSAGEREMLLKRRLALTPDFKIDENTGSAGDVSNFGYYHQPDITDILNKIYTNIDQQTLTKYGIYPDNGLLYKTVDGVKKVATEELTEIFKDALLNRNDVTSYYEYINDLNLDLNVEDRDKIIDNLILSDIEEEAKNHARAWEINHGQTGKLGVEIDPRVELASKQVAAQESVPTQHSYSQLLKKKTTIDPETLASIFPSKTVETKSGIPITYNDYNVSRTEDVKINWASSELANISSDIANLDYILQLHNKAKDIQKNPKLYFNNNVLNPEIEKQTKDNPKASIDYFFNNHGEVTVMGKQFLSNYSTMDDVDRKLYQNVYGIKNIESLKNTLEVLNNYNLSDNTALKESLIESVDKEAANKGIFDYNTIDFNTRFKDLFEKYDKLKGIKPKVIPNTQLRMQFNSTDNKINYRDYNTGETKIALTGEALLTQAEVMKMFNITNNDDIEDYVKLGIFKIKNAFIDNKKEIMYGVPMSVSGEALKSQSDKIDRLHYGSADMSKFDVPWTQTRMIMNSLMGTIDAYYSKKWNNKLTDDNKNITTTVSTGNVYSLDDAAKVLDDFMEQKVSLPLNVVIELQDFVNNNIQ